MIKPSYFSNTSCILNKCINCVFPIDLQIHMYYNELTDNDYYLTINIFVTMR